MAVNRCIFVIFKHLFS